MHNSQSSASSNALSKSRRSFLKLAAAAVAGASVARSGLPAFADAGEDPFGGLVPGLQSYSFRRLSLDNALAEARKLGVREVEIFPNHIAGLSPTQVTEKLAAHEIKCVSYGVVPFTADADKNRKVFELAKSLGCENISCDPTPDAFGNLDNLTEEFNITAGIHPHGPKHRWGKIDVMWEAVKDHSPKIGLCADTGHLIRAGEDPMRALEVFKDRLFALHVKDFVKVGDEKWEDVPAGQGSLAVDDVVKFLLDRKFTGAMLVEYEGKDEVANVGKTLDRVKQAVAKARG